MISVHCKIYEYDLSVVKKIQNLIKEKYKHLFFTVIVHGSIGNNEVIPYSDFDGVLVVKDEYKDSRLLGKFIKKSMRLIYQFDPLQHHGWFIICESQLKNYPESYFPAIIFENSKLIYPFNNSLTFNIVIKNQPDYKKKLLEIIDQIEFRINKRKSIYNVYELKCFLSQIMLLPSLYFSVRHNRAINKKDSFKEVKINFSDSEWMPIEIASKIRLNWNVKYNFIQLNLLTRSNMLLTKRISKYFYPKINEKVICLLDNNFYSNLKELIKTMKCEVL